jgi:DNA-binding NarL/FixJ family response regulator
MTIRLLIADDHQMFAEALKNLLETEQNLEVVACVNTHEDLMRALATAQPIHVALLDLRFGKRNMLDDLAVLRENAPGSKWVILTGFARVEESVKAIGLGCHGYIDKINPAARVIDAIHRIHRGQIVTLINSAPPEEDKSGGGRDEPKKPKLTPVQKEVLCLKVKGLKTKEIAEACGKSEPWVYLELRNLRNLFDTPTTPELIAKAVALKSCA